MPGAMRCSHRKSHVPGSAGLARRLLTTRDDRDVDITGGEAIGKNKKTDRNTVGVKDLELKGSKDVKGADLPMGDGSVRK